MQECCFPYWPKEKDTTMTYGKLKVQLLSEQDCGDFVIRKLEMGEADSHYQVPVRCVVVLTGHLCPASFHVLAIEIVHM